jgi:hypothetical protein
MRTAILTALAIGAVSTCLLHCSSEPVGPAPVPTTTVDPKPDAAPPPADAGADTAVEPTGPTTMAGLFKAVKGKVKALTPRDCRVSNTITVNGITFTIPANSIFDAPTCDDSDPSLKPFAGMADIEALGLNTGGEMARANRPTMLAAGAILESGGALEVHAFVGGKELCISRIKDIKFKAPAIVAAGAGPMSLWVSDTSTPDPSWKVPFAGPPAPDAACTTQSACTQDPQKLCQNQRSCAPFLCNNAQACRFDICVGTAACPGNPVCVGADVCSKALGCIDTPQCRVGCRGRCDAAECKDAPACRPVPVDASGTAPDYFFNGAPFGSIGHYNAANCDRLTSLPGTKITVKVPFGSNHSAEASVFFIPSTINSAVKLYTKLPTGDGFVSYTQSMPAGLAGKLVAISLKGGKYYYEERQVTLTDEGGATQTITVNPTELTYAALEAKLDAL